MLGAFADVYTPSDTEARDALARVRARIDRGDVVEVERTQARSRTWIAVGVVALAIAAAVVIAMRLDVAAMLASEVDDGDPEAAYAQPEAAQTGGEAIDRAPPRVKRSAPPPEVEVEPEPEPAPIPKPKPRPRNKTPRAADATLHAEMALLRPAQQALEGGNHRRALQLLDDHARSFPKSALAEERALGRIEALCGLGRGDEARKAAASFVRRFPGSPYRAKAERACP